ncbi:hypothetical protein B0H16DRAFT_1861030 [Mycena metata]|uniref:Uncharacterized protein n=1 Tax=Mycena metata TaxID=1033252 RepID=A0AAD7IGT3_9AGAR|nr:hypothetical protein B0H16DRAFT_1861030 [Mycena metata]
MKGQWVGQRIPNNVHHMACGHSSLPESASRVFDQHPPFNQARLKENTVARGRVLLSFDVSQTARWSERREDARSTGVSLSACSRSLSFLSLALAPVVVLLEEDTGRALKENKDKRGGGSGMKVACAVNANSYGTLLLIRPHHTPRRLPPPARLLTRSHTLLLNVSRSNTWLELGWNLGAMANFLSDCYRRPNSRQAPPRVPSEIKHTAHSPPIPPPNPSTPPLLGLNVSRPHPATEPASILKSPSSHSSKDASLPPCAASDPSPSSPSKTSRAPAYRHACLFSQKPQPGLKEEEEEEEDCLRGPKLKQQ